MNKKLTKILKRIKKPNFILALTTTLCRLKNKTLDIFRELCNVIGKTGSAISRALRPFDFGTLG